MGQINPNGNYSGRVYDAGESNNATLTINASDPQTGNISQASMNYYGLTFKVDGTFAYTNLTNESAVNFTLRAEAGSPDNNVLTITLNSPNRSYSELKGTVSVSRGGPNVGKTYNIEFRKN